MASCSGHGLVRFLSVSGKQFKWNHLLDSLLTLLQDEFSSSNWSLTKEDDKMAVIKATNVTVNWYKATKTIQIQGVNEQLVKQRFEHLILSAKLNDRQDSIDGTKTGNVHNHDASDLQADECGKKTAPHSEEIYNKPGQCHGCASLDAKLHQLRDYFQSEIDSLKERLPSGAANPNFSSSQSSLSDNKLLKKNQDLRRRLGEIESRFEILKADAKIIRDESKSLVTALRLLSSELTDSNNSSNLHPSPGEGVNANNSQDGCDTSETTPFIKVSHNRQRKQ
ncbi:hypothetical protein ACROYT_G005102 [Oculina patagonica]